MSKTIMMMKLKTNNDKKTLYVQDSDGEFVAVEYSEQVERYIDDWRSDVIDDEELLNRLDTDFSAIASKISDTVNTRLQKLSERISTDGMHIYIDGDDFEKVQLDKALEGHMVRMLTTRNDSEIDQRNWASFVAFTENLYNNTDPDIRVQIFSWMEAQGWLTLTEDGCIIGYKGCQKNPETGVAESIKRGPGIVDGVIYNGNIPNPDGAVVEIAKSLVEKDASVGCASGLHVGTYDYAADWANGVILKVKVNPRDIVSVPYDCSAQKIRCCRYEVLEHIDVEKRSWCGVDEDEGRLFPDDLSWGYEEDYPEEFLEWVWENFEFEPGERRNYCGPDCQLDDGVACDDGCFWFEYVHEEQFQAYCEENFDEWVAEYEHDEDDADGGCPMFNGGCKCSHGSDAECSCHDDIAFDDVLDDDVVASQMDMLAEQLASNDADAPRPSISSEGEKTAASEKETAGDGACPTLSIESICPGLDRYLDTLAIRIGDTVVEDDEPYIADGASDGGDVSGSTEPSPDPFTLGGVFGSHQR